MAAKLYMNPVSPHCKRVMVAAHEFGITLEMQMVDPSKGEHKTPEYLAMNPNAKIPTLVTEDGPMWESAAILTYWAEKFPEKNLMPKSLFGRYDCMRWMFWTACHYERAAFAGLGEKVIKPMMGGTMDAAAYAAAQKEHERFAAVVDGHLKNQAWMLGANFSIADIDLAIPVESAMMAGFDVSKFTHLKMWFDKVCARDSWKKSAR
jgi:glutathione S-transferase